MFDEKLTKGAEDAADEHRTSAIPNASFPSAEPRRVGQHEWQALARLGAAPNFLAREAVAWARAHPADPRNPEALHLAVRSTRYGCTNAETTRLSKEAFTLLHQRYAASAWAKKTPYYF